MVVVRWSWWSALTVVERGRSSIRHRLGGGRSDWGRISVEVFSAVRHGRSGEAVEVEVLVDVGDPISNCGRMMVPLSSWSDRGVVQVNWIGLRARSAERSR